MTEIKIKIEKPPIYESACATFGLDLRNIIFTYGDTIYNPGNLKLNDHTIEHEKVHMRQQGEHPELWWGKFLRDPQFRIQQESEAYAKQYQFICLKLKGREQRFNIRWDLSKTLSSNLYGNVISHLEAERLIFKLSGNLK